MTCLSVRPGKAIAAAAADAADAADLGAVRAAVDRARQSVVRDQRKDGSWDAVCETGPACTAQMLVALRFVGRLNPRDARDGARWLCEQQRQDGGFGNYPLAEAGDLCATATAWAGLRACGLGEDEPPLRRARAFVERNGGVIRTVEALGRGDATALFLAMTGLLDAREVPAPPLSFLLAPPLRRFLERRLHPGVLLGMVTMGVLARHLRGDFRSGLGSAVRRRCLQALDSFQNPNGSWNEIVQQAALALPTLVALGVPVSDDRITRCLAWLETRTVRDRNGLRFTAFGLPVFHAAQSALALLAAGASPGQPAVRKALEWLLDCQLDRPQPAFLNPRRGAPRTGGWAGHHGNETMPDCDDTAVVLSLLGLVGKQAPDAVLPESLRERLRPSAARGCDWLLGMQNPDGGWSAYCQGLPGKSPGPIMTGPVRTPGSGIWSRLRWLWRPPAELGDPSTEDVTARALHALGQHGSTAATPPVRRAIAFLRRQQCAGGAWWGRWEVNYLQATAEVLRGLAAVGADLEAGWVRRAVRWLLARQNPDGGWGEGVASYRDPGLAGVGPSLAPVTAEVLLGLLAAGEGDSPAVSRGVRYLLRHQRADGTWSEAGFLCPLIPPDLFYTYAGPARYGPLEALGRYLAVRQGRTPAAAAGHPGGAFLEAMRRLGDPDADAAVEKVFARGAVTRVNEALAGLWRGGGLDPSRLPPVVEGFFRQTALLPDWADPVRLARAGQLFQRYDREIAVGLFGSSLPQVFALGNANAARIAAFGQATTYDLRQQIYRTAQFLYDVFAEGGLAPGGRGVAAVQNVRLLHAAIRHLALRRPDWDPAWGVPINQEDMAATLLAFSCASFDALRRLGLPVTAEEGEAWLHAWAVVGYLFGLRDELLPRSAARAEALREAIRGRQWAPSPGGRRLAGALVDLMQQRCPRRLRGLPVSLIRHLAGNRCADLLGLPSADWTRWLVRGGTAFLRAACHGAGLRVGRGESRWLTPLYDAGERLMESVVGLYRRGEQAQFRLPAALASAPGGR